MDRRVIVLSPTEWERRTELGDSLHVACNHTHYATTYIGSIKTQLFSLKNDIKKGASFAEIESSINDLLITANQTMSEVRRSQEIIGGIKTMIEYRPKEA